MKNSQFDYYHYYLKSFQNFQNIAKGCAMTLHTTGFMLHAQYTQNRNENEIQNYE